MERGAQQEPDLDERDIADNESEVIAAYRLRTVIDAVEADYEYSGGSVVLFTHPYILEAWIKEYYSQEELEEYRRIEYIELSYKFGEEKMK